MSISRDELETLYCNCNQQLFTCALVITNSPTLAEDAVHEAFCRLLRSTGEATNLKAYVFRAVRNAALDQVRRRTAPCEPLPEMIFDPSPSSASVVEAAEFKRRVIELLQRLTIDERETIVQHLFGELTFQEIATIRARPLGTITSWYRRGIEKLQRELEVPDGFI